MSLSDLLRALEKEGCCPCISMRSKGVWRGTIDGLGNYWAEGRTPKRALAKAITLWKKAKPSNGMAMLLKRHKD